MRKNILYFLAIFIMPMLLLAEPVLSLVGVDSDGNPMRFGSGAWTESFCHPSIVSDNGTVLFIAQMADVFLDRAENRDRFRAVYEKKQANAGSEILVEGYDPIALLLGSKWWRTTWQITGAGTSDAFYLIREDVTDDTGNSNLNVLCFPNPNISTSLPSDVTRQTLRLASGGDMVAVTADYLDVPLFYQVSDANFTAVDIQAAFNGYTQKGIALNPDATVIYFTSIEDLSDSDEFVEGKLGLYAYDRNQQSCKLVTFIGGSRLDSQVQCAASAEVIVYRSWLANGKLTANPQIFVSWLDQSGNYVSRRCSQEEFPDCADPQISADGRFVVFSAIPQDNSVSQIFRFDRLTDTLEQVTQANANAHTPAISSNGRYIALVSAATNFGHNITLPQVWLADMGPAPLDASLDIFQEQTLELPIEIGGASENARITLISGEPVPAGIFYDKDGNPLVPNQEYSLDSLPWRYKAGETETGTVTVTIQITDGAFTKTAELQIHIYDKNKAILSCVSLNVQGKYVGDYRFAVHDVSCSEDGSKIAFVTNLPLVIANNYNASHAYLRDLKNGTLKLLSGDQDLSVVTNITISGDGNFVYFIRNSKLWQYAVNTKQLTELISSGIDDIKPATDVSGSILAYSQNNGQAILQFPGQNPITPAPDLTCTALRLSRDGKVLALLDSDKRLHIWFTDAAQLVKLADNVVEFAMNQAGSEVFFRQGDKLFRQHTAMGEATEVALPAGITATNLQNLQVSGNGRFLTWVRDFTLNEVPYPAQQFLFDLSNSHELLISRNDQDQPGNGPCSTTISAAFSATGRKLFFASMASNLLTADDNNTWDFFLARLPDIPADAPSVNPDVLHTEEDTDPPAELPLTLISPEGNALVPMLHAAHSRWGMPLTLLGPVPGRNGYAVRYEPEQNFCGKDQFKIWLWDGAARNDKPQTITINVTNVNDPPVAEPVDKTIDEGAGVTVDLLAFADDPDLRNPDPDKDELTFTLQADAPAWVQVDGNELRLTPGYLTVRHPDNSKEFEFTVLVRDKQGEEVEMPVTITVKDVNQAPILKLKQNTIIQQGNDITISADVFDAADPDPEDMDRLRTFVQAGSISYEIPYTFTPDAADQLQFTVYVKDAQGAVSNHELLTILLRKVTFQTAEVWEYNELGETPSWEALYRGWNLLSIPFAANAAEISGIFGEETVLWVWNTENSRYNIANSLEPGQGFWIYIDDLSEISPEAQTLSSGRIAPPALEPGWNLRGTDWQETELPESGWMLSPASSWKKTGVFLPGKAYWLFIQE